MTIDPDGLTFVAGVLSLGGLVFGTLAVVMKHKRDAIVRELEDLATRGQHADQD